MKIVSINLGKYGSTGKIMIGISQIAEQRGHQCYQAYPGAPQNYPREEKDIRISSFFSKRVSAKLAYYTGYNGCFAALHTWIFLKKLDKIKPDLLHFHNLHNSYINLPMLFNYVKKNKIKVIWTLHDCWAMTGQCPHFTVKKCGKWKSGCYDCPQIDIYPAAIVDRTKFMWKKKKEWFTGVENLTVVTPSEWLAGLAEQSYLKNYPVRVIHNGIDLNVFKPTASGFREKYNLKDNYILLGVSFGWGFRKGLDVFKELADRLDERFKIVLVGTDENTDKQLSDNIVSIHRTNNQRELAEIYTAADLFVNPTREDNYPTVNMESLACGTPIITFRTGGSTEALDVTCGCIVECDDVDALEQKIIEICENKLFSQEACLEHAKMFNENDLFAEYVELYENMRKN
ncbi:MAG: glycosyltransferase [Eubacterium sp.]|nr:glycosyltransferase [Eubacterium sp.]